MKPPTVNQIDQVLNALKNEDFRHAQILAYIAICYTIDDLRDDMNARLREIKRKMPKQ